MKQADQKLERLNLEPVMPLLEYLHGLSQDCCDRELTRAEDERACLILLRLPDLLECVTFKSWLRGCTDPEYQRFRSLCTWYSIARSAAIQIEQGCTCGE